MNEKTKIKIRIQPKVHKSIQELAEPEPEPVAEYNISNLRNKFTSDSYYRTSRSLINKINRHFGWGEDILPVKQYEQNFNKIITFIMESYVIRNHEMLMVKLSAIRYPLKLYGYNGDFMDKHEELKDVDYTQNGGGNTSDWAGMIQILDKHINECSHPGGRIVALAYKNGYFVNMTDMIRTKVDAPEEGYNYLDLKQLLWKIEGNIDKNRPNTVIKVSREFADFVKNNIRKGSVWLISKKGGFQYTSPVAMKHLGLSEFNLGQVKHAYSAAQSENDQ